MKLSRRGLIAGAVAVPTVVGLASWRWQHGERSVLLHDPSLPAGLRFARAGRASGGEVMALEGDRVRLMREIVRGRPALIAGVSLSADALMAEDIAREAGYVRVAELHGIADRCGLHSCRPGWQALGRMAQSAGSQWAEALAEFAVRPGEAMQRPAPSAFRFVAPSEAIGWLLARQA